jgi:hypothetical protein
MLTVRASHLHECRTLGPVRIAAAGGTLAVLRLYCSGTASSYGVASYWMVERSTLARSVLPGHPLCWCNSILLSYVAGRPSYLSDDVAR